MNFKRNNNNEYELGDEDLNALIELQNLFIQKLNSGLFDKNINIEIINKLMDFINKQLEESIFSERAVYINEQNYKRLNEFAVRYFPLYTSYGVALIKSYKEFLKKNSDQFLISIDCPRYEFNIRGRMEEIEIEFRKFLDSHSFVENKPMYGTTMLIVGMLERAFINNLINMTMKDLLLTLNKNHIDAMEEFEKNVLDIGIKVFADNEQVEALEDSDDFEDKLVKIICKYRKLKSAEVRDLEKLILDHTYTLGSALNNSFTKKYVNSSFLEFFKLLFSFEKLNLRNDIMHCSTHKTYDPSDFNITAIMFHLFILTYTHVIFN